MKTTPTTRWVLTGIYTLLIAMLSLLSGDMIDETPDLFPHQDKVGHFVAYAGYALLLAWSWRARRKTAWPVLTVIVVYCAAYGIAMEWLQATFRSGERFFSVADMLANGAGALVCAVVCLVHQRRLAETARPTSAHETQR